MFKTAVEVQLFITVTTALVLKSLHYQSQLSSRNDGAHAEQSIVMYDSILMGSFYVCIPCCFTWAVYRKKSVMQTVLRDGRGEITDGSTASKQRAIQLLQVGLVSPDEMHVLHSYFQWLNNMVHQWNHVFISCERCTVPLSLATIILHKDGFPHYSKTLGFQMLCNMPQ